MATLISRISLRISGGTGGRSPRGRDFQRQYKRKPARRHSMTVAGGPNNRKRIKNAKEEAIKTNEHQPVDGTEGLLLGGGSSQNNDLLPQR
jgi:hypothetical protein